MKLNHILHSGKLAAWTAIAAVAFGLFACKDDDVIASGETHFDISGMQDGKLTLTAAGSSTSTDATGMADLASGIVFPVNAKGSWKITPTDETVTWARIYPLSGTDEGAIRIYAQPNTNTQRRTASYTVTLNGVEQPQLLTVDQDPAPAKFLLSANNVQFSPAGGSFQLTVTSNVEWDIEYDTSLTWLTIKRDGNNVVIAAPYSNETGGHLTTTIYVRGLEPYENEVFPIIVTQLSVLFFDDFSWFPPTSVTDAPQCWLDAASQGRVDQWPSKFKNTVDAEILKRWTGVFGVTDAKAYSYALFNYIRVGSASKTGNICSPAIAKIEGKINAKVSWDMAGFCTKKNLRSDCNEFYVALLGPGKIVDATAGGNSTAFVATGRFTIPYSSTGAGNTHDVDLTETAGFTIGSNGYFDMNETTGLKVWESPDVKFSISIEGMTNETRIVFIGSEADKVTMLNNWETSGGEHSDSRKCLDNFMVEQN